MAQPALKIPDFDTLYRQIEALPEGLTGEILDPGALYTRSRPGRRHRLAERRIRGALVGADFVEGGDGWWLDMEAEIRIGDRLVVPDLSGWRLDDTSEEGLAFLDENPILRRPDWCCEVLSPTTAQVDRFRKLLLYMQAGISHVWLVDPETRLVEVYVPHQGLALLVQVAHEDDLVTLAPFAGEIAVGSWWRDLPVTRGTPATGDPGPEPEGG